MVNLRRVPKYAVRGAKYLRCHGARLTLARVLQGVAGRLSRPPGSSKGGVFSGKIATSMLVSFDDAARLDWTDNPHWRRSPRRVERGKPIVTGWIVSPPGESSGGHQNIFRFLKFLEDAGHQVKIYLYSSSPTPISLRDVQKMLERNPSYPQLDATIEVYDPRKGVSSDVDALFATGWETAYPVYLDPTNARRCYFVQDFEPYFYSVGSEFQLAENTYRFGFEGFTAGGWLASKLAAEYGMTTHPFDFATDVDVYTRSNNERRNAVFFYARPVTTRRGFEIGMMALAQVKARRPQAVIHMAGWDVSDWDVPFDYVNHGAMNIDQLPELYNQCSAALVLSLTNLSLLPLELLSCGTIPVVNDASNNRMVSNNPYIAYAPPSPKALADRIIEILDDPNQVGRSREAAESMKGSNWADSGLAFITAFEESMYV